MPLTVFDVKGIPATRRELIEAAIEKGGKHLAHTHEAWVATDSLGGGVRVLITGPQRFERRVLFGIDEEPAEITRRVKETLDE